VVGTGAGAPVTGVVGVPAGAAAGAGVAAAVPGNGPPLRKKVMGSDLTGCEPALISSDFAVTV